MKKHFVLILAIFSFNQVLAQNIEIFDLSFDSVSKIDKQNDTIISNEILPDIKNISNSIFQHSLLESKRSNNLPEYYIEATKRKMRESNVQNDYTNINRYVIYKENEQVITKEFPTNIEYVYNEGCGLERTVVIKNLYCNKSENVIGTFSSEIINAECSEKYIEIKDETKWHLDLNKEFVIDNYKLKYSGSLCTGHFSFKGLGTTQSTYYNLKLEIVDKESGKSQTILKIPHMHIYRIKSILLADINSDSRKDIVLSLQSDLCVYQLVYLSNLQTDSLFSYIGYSLECDCP